MGRLARASRALVKCSPQDERSVDTHPRGERLLDRPRQRDGGRERKRIGKPHVLKIYPAIGKTSEEGHNFVYSKVDRWETDVFKLLDANVR
jgi:hypothetical protein